MGDKCSRCRAKHAVTKCIQGKLCHACGQRCHPNYHHPVDFLGLNKRPLTTKSLTSLAGPHFQPTPKRLTKARSVQRNILPLMQIRISPSKRSASTKNTPIRNSRKVEASRRREQSSKKSTPPSELASEEKEMKFVDVGTMTELWKPEVQPDDRKDELISLLRDKVLKEKEANRNLKEKYHKRLKQMREARS